MPLSSRFQPFRFLGGGWVAEIDFTVRSHIKKTCVVQELFSSDVLKVHQDAESRQILAAWKRERQQLRYLDVAVINLIC